MKNIIKNNKKLIAAIFIVFVGIMLFQIKISKNTSLIRQSNEVLPNGEINEALGSDFIKQNFISENNTLQSFSVYFNKEEIVENSNIEVQLIKENDLVQTWNIQKADIESGKYSDFILDNTLHNIKGKEFLICIRNMQENGNISLFINDDTEESKIIIGNQIIDNSSICYRLIYKSLNKNSVFGILTLVILIIFILCSLILLPHKIKICNVYLVLGISLSTLYFVSLPLLAAPDENGHFFRAYEISEGYMLSDKSESGMGGRNLPTNLYSFDANSKFYDIWQAKDIDITDDTTFYQFGTLSLYAPISYAPQMIGELIGRVISDSPIVIGYLGRLMNCIAIIIITYFSIKYTPIGKEIMLIIALIPMNLHQSISLSPDGMVVALSFAIIAFVLYMRYEKKDKMNKYQYLIMYLLGITISLYKIVYIPFCILLFLIPKERFKSNKDYITNVIVMILLVIALNLGWLIISSGYLVEFQEGVNSREQVKFILCNPFKFIKVIATTVYYNGREYIYTMIGRAMGWLNVINDVRLVYIYLAVIISTFFISKDENKYENDAKMRIYMMIVAVIIVLITFTSLYVQWTKVGVDRISGVQGRYFISLLLPVLLALKSDKIKIQKSQEVMKYIYLLAVAVNICCCINVFYSYII